MPSHNRNARRTFTMLELLIALFIMGIMASALMAMLGSFSFRRQLDTSVFSLLNDLRQTQAFSLSMRDGCRYYGLRFEGGLGSNGDRVGYNITRYDPPAGTNCTDYTYLGSANLTRCTVIKSSKPAETPEFLEDTFFNRLVGFAADSDFKVPDVIVFNENGSATSDGATILTKDKINLTVGDNKRTITLTPLTGYVRIQ